MVEANMKRLILVLLGISLLGAWTTDAKACSCERASRQQLRDKLPLSFDGRVTATEVLKTVVRGTVSVVRKIKGEVSDQLDVFAWRLSLGCTNVGSVFEVALATGQVLEFGVAWIDPWRVPELSDFKDAVPFVGECSLSRSEIYPVPKGTGVRLWRQD